MNEFFDLLGKQDKLTTAIIFVNSEKNVQRYILSLHFHLFLVIEDDQLHAPILDIGTFNYHEFMARCMMTVTSTAAPRNFAKAIMQPAWHPAINKEIGNFIDNTCFQWIKDVGQRRMMMI